MTSMPTTMQPTMLRFHRKNAVAASAATRRGLARERFTAPSCTTTLGHDQHSQRANRREAQCRLDTRRQSEALSHQQQRGASHERREDHADGHQQHVDVHDG